MDEGIDFEVGKSRSLQAADERVKAMRCVTLSEFREDGCCDI